MFLFITLNHLFYFKEITGKCANHHHGELCYTCDDGYARLRSRGLCELCSTSVMMYVKFAFALCCIYTYILIQIRITFKGSVKGFTGILMKQLLSHFQQIGMISLLDLGWTSEIKDYFALQEYFSFISEELVSADCVFERINSNLLAKNVVIASIMPFALGSSLAIPLFAEAYYRAANLRKK